MKKLSCFLFALVSGCGFFSTKDLPDLPTLTDPIAIHEQWKNTTLSTPSDLHLMMSPAIVADTLYAADNKGTVIALTAASGDLLWKQKTHFHFSSGVAAGPQHLYVGTTEGEVVGLTRATGKPLFHTKVGSEILSAPLAAAEGAVVKASDGYVAYLNPTGAILWRQSETGTVLSLRAQGSPVLAGETVFVPGLNGKMQHYHLKNGTLLHSLPLFESKGRSDIERMLEVTSTPEVHGDRLYAAAFHGGASVVSISRGAELFKETGSFMGIAAVSPDEVILVEESGTVSAWDTRRHIELWVQKGLGMRTLTAPVLYKKWVVVGDEAGFAHFLDLKTGELKGRVSLGRHAILAKPLIHKDSLILIDETGTLAAFEVR